MSEKREKILAVARQLFIEVGVSGTTIAEIAKRAGIAKGSVYSHFTSKQAIVVALMNQSIERSQSYLTNLLEGNPHSGKTLMTEYFTEELSFMNEDRSLNQAIAMDDSLLMNDEIMDVIQSFRAEYYRKQIVLLRKAYGEKHEKWLTDILTLLNGAFHEYGLYMTLDNANLDVKACAEVVALSLEASLTALSKSTLQPALNAESVYAIESKSQLSRQEKASAILKNMLSQAKQLTAESQKEVTETCELMAQELAKEQPNKVLLRALIANLGPYPEIHRDRIELAEALDIAVI
ncbi:TetR/AcrR family transcriptional regulator [Alteromonas sediminis]|uniref:TetR/AcrR family transcriptional regulator n=1 Tax=Alteromonas sediminis TaxID=2259342 RepID=A0A3N5XZF3_9ALTE|nr:TetR/AcrR family transcriptional regulator [Alteromonas sediminis]RPJ65893.1 TetR/AcrR family transcriptional regulator [Alteromonas sediminis]